MTTTTRIHTDHFQGMAFMRVRDMPGYESYFQGKKRLYSVVVRGKFLHSVPAHELKSGQIFRDKVDVPFFFSSMMSLTSRLVPDLLFPYTSEKRLLALSSLMRGVNRLHVSTEQDKDWEFVEVVEDTSILNLPIPNPHCWKSRREFFTSANLSTVILPCETERGEPLYYTFEFFSEYFSPRRNELVVLGYHIKLDSYLNHQPVRILACIVKPHSRGLDDIQEEDRDCCWNIRIDEM